MFKMIEHICLYCSHTLKIFVAVECLGQPLLISADHRILSSNEDYALDLLACFGLFWRKDSSQGLEHSKEECGVCVYTANIC